MEKKLAMNPNKSRIRLLGSRNALIVDTETPYRPASTYNYVRMTRRDGAGAPQVLIAPWAGALLDPEVI